MTPASRTTGTVGLRRKRSLIQFNMGGTVAVRALEGKRSGMTQDRLGVVRIAAFRTMEYERR